MPPAFVRGLLVALGEGDLLGVKLQFLLPPLLIEQHQFSFLCPHCPTTLGFLGGGRASPCGALGWVHGTCRVGGGEGDVGQNVGDVVVGDVQHLHNGQQMVQNGVILALLGGLLCGGGSCGGGVSVGGGGLGGVGIRWVGGGLLLLLLLFLLLSLLFLLLLLLLLLLDQGPCSTARVHELFTWWWCGDIHSVGLGLVQGRGHVCCGGMLLLHPQGSCGVQFLHDSLHVPLRLCLIKERGGLPTL